MTIPLIILLIIAFAIYLVKPSWLMLLWLISEPLLAPFIVLFSGVTDFEEQQAMVWGLWGLYNKLFIVLLFVEIIKLFFRPHHFSRKITPLLLPISALFVFIIFHNIVTNFYPFAILRGWLFVFYTVLPLLVFLLNKKMWPNIKALYLTVLIVCLIQLIAIPFNLEGLFAYAGRYAEILKGHTEASMMPGTFTRSNMMADYVAIVYMLITIDYFSRRSISFFQYIIVSAIVWIPLLFAGSKLPIIVTIINIFLCIIVFNRKRLISVLSAFAIIGSITAFLISNRGGSESNIDGLNRIVEGTSDFVKNSKKRDNSDNSTFSISVDLIDRYFFSSPIVGHGNAYDDNERAYLTDSGEDLSDLKSDASLAFYLVEYGLIGLLLFLFYHFKIIKLITFPFPPQQRNNITMLIFTFFVLFAVTERGLFNRGNFIFLFSYFFALARFYEEKNEYGRVLENKKI